MAFWFFSMGGGLMTLVYGIVKREPVIILGQALATIIYVRNIMLIVKNRASGSQTLIVSRYRPAAGAHSDATSLSALWCAGSSRGIEHRMPRAGAMDQKASRLSGAHARQTGCGFADRGPSVDDRVMKLFEHEAKGGQIALRRSLRLRSNRAVSRRMSSASHCNASSSSIGIDFSHQCDRGQQLFAMQRIQLSFVALYIVAQPGAGRPEHGKKQTPRPRCSRCICP